MRSQRILVALLTIVFGAAVLAARPAAAEGWELTLAPYFWMISADGKLGVNGQKEELDASFSDILDASDSYVAFNADVKLSNGRFGLLFAPSWAQIGVDDVANGTPLEADVTFDMLFMDMAVLYRAVDWPMSNPAGDHTRVTVDALVGARYTWLQPEIDFDNAGSPDRENDWWDPIVGADAKIDITPRFFLTLRGDVGGFGAGSEWTTNAASSFGVRFNVFGINAAVRAGYRVLYQDFDEGGFDWRMTIHGPILGFMSEWK